MEKYEYYNIYLSDEEVFEQGVSMVDMLNRMGAEGWRFTGHSSDTGSGTTYLMERVLEEKPEECGEFLKPLMVDGKALTSATGCVRDKGHSMPHRDGRGCEWIPKGPDPAPEETSFTRG